MLDMVEWVEMLHGLGERLRCKTGHPTTILVDEWNHRHKNLLALAHMGNPFTA
jgi:hypothetical protein